MAQSVNNLDLSDEAFIENQIQFQLGDFGTQDFSIPFNKLMESNTFPSPIFGGFDAQQNRLLALNGCQAWLKCINGNWRPEPAHQNVKKIARIGGFLNSLKLYAPQKQYLFDFWDGRVKTTPQWLAGQNVPVFQYNRLQHARNAILWPLVNYHTIGHSYFLEDYFADPIAFENKIPKIAWRGMPTGGGFDKECKTHVNINSILNHFEAGLIDVPTLHRQLQLIRRYQFVARYARHELFDVGFSISNPNQNFLATSTVIRQYLKAPLTKFDHCQFKYLVALSGWDVATSFYWMLNTNSVVFKESYPHETFADCHFKPWVHFVPISTDYDDIIGKFEWCEANPEDCRMIVKNAHHVCRKLLQRRLRKTILQSVVQRYERRLQA